MRQQFYSTPMAYAHNSSETSDRRWYIRVGGTVYGSFDDQTLWTYVCEGRVTGQSELSLSPTAGFYPAAQRREIAHWFQQQQAPTAPPAPKPEQVILIMAEIRSGQPLHFMQTLQSLGDAQRIGDTVWLLRSSATLDQISDMLNPTLAPADRLLIIDASKSDYAAINLGPAVETRIGMMFDDPTHGPSNYG